jgi:Ca2+-binding RTX toxin-like protein
VRDNALTPERLNPQFVDPRTEEGLATNAGLLAAGQPGAGAVALVTNNNTDQPLRRYGKATQGNDSLSVRSAGALDPDGGLYGLGGNDRLEGDSSGDNLYGGPGDDGLYGRGGADVLVGSGGNDTLEGGRGQDLLDGGPGNDRLNGGFGEDSLSGGSGNDRLVGVGGGRDTIDCGSGTDTVIADKSDVVKNCEKRG